MGPAYVAGLIGTGDRKSMQPMAARGNGVGYDQPHHFTHSSLASANGPQFAAWRWTPVDSCGNLHRP
jgi:hypothetical protein